MSQIQQNLQSMIDQNPHAARDRDTMKAALDAIKKLREMGYKPKRYDLASPFERHRAREAANKFVKNVSNITKPN